MIVDLAVQCSFSLRSGYDTFMTGQAMMTVTLCHYGRDLKTVLFVHGQSTKVGLVSVDRERSAIVVAFERSRRLHA